MMPRYGSPVVIERTGPLGSKDITEAAMRETVVIRGGGKVTRQHDALRCSEQRASRE